MRIAEISNIREAVPPRKYGGTEYVISAVTEGLVKKDHAVTLFATGDSKTGAQLESVCDQALGFDDVNETVATLLLIRHLNNFARQSEKFDIIHNHILETFALVPYLNKSFVTTLHTDLSRPAEQAILQTPEAQKTCFISISDAQRKSLPRLPYLRTIYHGIPIDEFPFREERGEYLVFLGRITPEKGVEVAVETAKQTGRKLIVAAKVDEPLSAYAKEMLKLFEETPEVEFIGQVGEEKKELLANAYAMLMPIQWDEPFGLVVIEALVTGTPVIAFRRGSMPEIIEEGKTGFLVTTTKEMIDAVNKVATLDRKKCRESVEQRFSLDQMVTSYEQVFTELARGY
ncbi:MAG: glycosyltransferase family 4 protein [Candidatus Andersenbacteria bacterium]